jgi:ribosomal protein S15
MVHRSSEKLEFLAPMLSEKHEMRHCIDDNSNAAADTHSAVPEGYQAYVYFKVLLIGISNPSPASAPSQFVLPFRPFSSTPVVESKTTGRPRKRGSHDPYIVAQRARKRAANLTRRADLEKQRVESLGNPVRGISTPFVESFESGLPLQHAADKKVPKDEFHLNYALKPKDVQISLDKSKDLAVPRMEPDEQRTDLEQKYKRTGRGLLTQVVQAKELSPEEMEARREKDHTRASEAISRITALSNGSSKDRMRVNITRCISTFGRHNTDRLFPPRAPPLPYTNSTDPHPIRPETNEQQLKKRVGPDTGSSEVQIAILTAKIKTLADFLSTRGKRDKHGKRDLRLLVHRRQKLLAYLRKKERGGPRWQHCIETLGLTEGTWKGEISL